MERRFIRTHREGGLYGPSEIWVDRETGVNYLFHAGGYAGGLTPLLGRNGMPVISAVHEED